MRRFRCWGQRCGRSREGHVMEDRNVPGEAGGVGRGRRNLSIRHEDPAYVSLILVPR